MDCSASIMTVTGMDLHEHLKLRLYGPIGHLVMACEQGRGYKKYGSFIQQEYQPNSEFDNPASCMILRKYARPGGVIILEFIFGKFRNN